MENYYGKKRWISGWNAWQYEQFDETGTAYAAPNGRKVQRQAELEAKEIESSVGGGAVTVKVSGKKEILSVKLDEEVVDPDDIEMLEDLIVAATNEALRKVEDENAAMMQQLTGGLGGLF